MTLSAVSSETVTKPNPLERSPSMTMWQSLTFPCSEKTLVSSSLVIFQGNPPTYSRVPAACFLPPPPPFLPPFLSPASLTVRLRPMKSFLFIPAIAFSPSSSFANVTNPKPRLFPVSVSFITIWSTTLPYFWNASNRSSSDTFWDMPPTKSLRPFGLSLRPPPRPPLWPWPSKRNISTSLPSLR